MTARALLSVFAVYVVFWCVCGLALWGLLRGTTAAPACPLWHLTSAFAVAWTAGFLSLVVPGGLGVREGTLLLLLRDYYPLEVAAALVVMARILWMACELACVAIAFLCIRVRGAEKGCEP